jgi:hypothetical protein
MTNLWDISDYDRLVKQCMTPLSLLFSRIKNYDNPDEATGLMFIHWEKSNIMVVLLVRIAICSS